MPLAQRDLPSQLRNHSQRSELRDSAPLLLPAPHVSNTFGLLTPAVKEAVHRAGQAHFFEPPPQCLAAAVKSHGDIAQRRAEACGDSFSRLAQDIGSPDDISIARLERWQQLTEAVTDYPVAVGL